jgi:flagellar biosynthetic protein FliR
MSELALSGGQTAALLIVIARTTGFVAAAPFFSSRALPSPAKAGLIIVMGWFFARTATPAGEGALPWMAALPLELIAGIAIGYLLSLAIEILALIGRLIGLQTGLSLEGVYNPLSANAGQTTALESLLSALSTIALIGAGYHLLCIGVIGASFSLLPVGAGIGGPLLEMGPELIIGTFTTAVAIGLPLILFLLIVDVVMAVVSRAVPQLNVLIVGPSVKLIVAVAGLAVSLPLIVNGLVRAAETLAATLGGGATGP